MADREQQQPGWRILSAAGTEGGTTTPYNWNHNQHVISGNVVFAPIVPAGPAIYCRGCHRSYISGNNLEGEWNPAILLESTWQSRLDGNGGEAGSSAGLIFVALVDSDANFLSDLGTSTSEGQILYYLARTHRTTSSSPRPSRTRMTSMAQEAS